MATAAAVAVLALTAACGGGGSADSGGRDRADASARPERTHDTGGHGTAFGDGSVRFTMRDARGRDAPTVVTVVRAGGSTATFLSVGVTGDPAPVPGTVVEGQWRQLAGAARP
ncbi:hypothetical protein [Streptomyces phytohabitans]|uniref:hypothetical protein n=1 Tax=Streptomyces phytohabitans TaxID=1150371 RepID=UPI00345C5455